MLAGRWGEGGPSLLLRERHSSGLGFLGLQKEALTRG